MRHSIACLMLVVAGLFLCAAATAADRGQIDAAVMQLAKFKHGDAREAVAAVEQLVRETREQPELRAYLEVKLGDVLGSAASEDAKLMACQQLWIIGPTRSAKALAELLLDEKLSHAAAYATGNSASPIARQILREAAKVARGRAACNVLNALGVCRDEEAVEVIKARIGDGDPAVAEAAIAALGRIGNPAAAVVLADVRAAGGSNRPIALLASLNCAEGLTARGQDAAARAIYTELLKPAEPAMTRRGALDGLISLGGDPAMSAAIAAMKGNEPVMAGTAIAAVRKLPGEQVTAQLAQLLPTLEPDVQAILIEALAGRGGDAARKAVEQSAASESPAVRLAAIRSLGKIGDASTVDLLVKAAAGPDEMKRAAMASLGQLAGGEQTDAAILAKLAGADASLRAGLIKALGDRRAAGAVPELLKQAGDADVAVARAALEALGNLAGAQHLADLLKIVQSAGDEAVRRAAEQAAVSIALRSPDAEKRADGVIEAFKAAQSPEARAALARVLGGIANTRSAEALKEAAREGDQQVRDAALRALAGWPDTSVTAFLINAARLTDANNLRRALAIRGALRQMADAAPKPDAPAQLTEWFVKAEGLVRGPDEKRLLLSGLANLRNPEAIRLVKNYLEDQEVAPEAQLAALQIAENLRLSNKAECRELAIKVRDTTKEPATKAKANRLLAVINAK